MPKYGWQGQLGWAEETTWGTTVAINRWQEFISENVNLSIGRIYSPGIRGTRSRQQANYVTGARDPKGSLTFHPWSKGLGLWFKHALGTNADTQPNAGADPSVWLHTMTPNDVLPAGLTMELNKVGQWHKYAGCHVNRMVMQVRPDALPIFTFDVVAKDETVSGSGSTATYPSTVELLSFHQCVFKIGGVQTDVYEANVQIDNFLRVNDWRTGALTRYSLDPMAFAVTGSFKLPYDATTQYAAFTAMTVAALNIKFTGSIIPGGSGTLNSSLELDIPVVFYNGDTPNVTGSEAPVDITIPFVAVKGAGSVMTLRYQNTETGAQL